MLQYNQPISFASLLHNLLPYYLQFFIKSNQVSISSLDNEAGKGILCFCKALSMSFKASGSSPQPLSEKIYSKESTT
jgi:hypothetical protein